MRDSVMGKRITFLMVVQMITVILAGAVMFVFAGMEWWVGV